MHLTDRRTDRETDRIATAILYVASHAAAMVKTCQSSYMTMRWLGVADTLDRQSDVLLTITASDHKYHCWWRHFFYECACDVI